MSSIEMMKQIAPICALLLMATCFPASAHQQTFQISLEATQESSSTVKVTDEEAWEHRLKVDAAIRAERGERRGESFIWVRLEIVVDENGTVVSANATNGPPEFFQRAVELARNWKFQPFVRQGTPVKASFTYSISVLPAEELPTTHVPFPEIHDWKSLRITLRRTVCYGTCPDYSVEIHGDGSVVYTGNSHVAVKGKQQGQLTQDELRQLVSLFRTADFYSLRDTYRCSVTDNPTYTTSISINGRTKTVLDYVGREIGMPQAVTDLEDAIDRMAGTAKWVKGNRQAPH
jgi:hypothetical protein